MCYRCMTPVYNEIGTLYTATRLERRVEESIYHMNNLVISYIHMGVMYM